MKHHVNRMIKDAMDTTDKNTDIWQSLICELNPLDSKKILALGQVISSVFDAFWLAEPFSP
jgi:hypothetical protein